MNKQKSLDVAWTVLVLIMLSLTVTTLFNSQVSINEVSAMTKIASQEFFKGHAVYWVPN